MNNPQPAPVYVALSHGTEGAFVLGVFTDVRAAVDAATAEVASVFDEPTATEAHADLQIQGEWTSLDGGSLTVRVSEHTPE